MAGGQTHFDSQIASRDPTKLTVKVCDLGISMKAGYVYHDRGGAGYGNRLSPQQPVTESGVTRPLASVCMLLSVCWQLLSELHAAVLRVEGRPVVYQGLQ